MPGLPFGSAGCAAATAAGRLRVTAGAPRAALLLGVGLSRVLPAALHSPCRGVDLIAPSVCSHVYSSVYMVGTHVASTEAESSVFV